MQDEHLERVSRKIAVHILDFCRARLASRRTFHMAELESYVRENIGLAPDSPRRVFNDLRKRRVLGYTLLSRRHSHYRIDWCLMPLQFNPAKPLAFNKPILLDFESRSRADLKVVGGRRYWEHPSSEALCCVWYDTRDGTVGVWAPGQPWPHPGRVLAAHNAHGFDRFAAERYKFNAADWIDTSQLARKAGLPGKLDALAHRWLGAAKDDEGNRFTRSFSTVRRPPAARLDTISEERWSTFSVAQKRTHGILPIVDAAALERIVRYCASDVQILVEAWPRLATYLPWDAAVERIDRILNDRGICFDIKLARRLLEEDSHCAHLAVSEAARVLHASPKEVAAAARSPAQFCAITGAPNAQAETVEQLAHPLAKVRKALASISRGKLEAGLARVHADGRLRDTLLYYGAHTGRWSGRGMQLQNMPRPAKQFEDLPADTRIPHTIKEGKRVVDVDAYADAVLAGADADADGIALLVRATLCASPGNTLVACDFSSVEARATAWAAGDRAALDVFRSGRDPYKVAAAAVFGVPYEAVSKDQRQIGKCCELALGYQGGPNAFRKIAHTYKIKQKIIDALDLDAIVAKWRNLHAPIANLWTNCGHAFHKAFYNGDSYRAGKCLFERTQDGASVICYLPSERQIVYNDVEASPDEDTSYLGTRGREHLYGGKLVENAIQGLCRDLMTDALLRVEAAGLNPVLTVHDEIVCDVPEADAEAAYKALHSAMIALPVWAADFPIDANGWTGKRYRK